MMYSEMLKPALVEMAVDRGILKNKSEGRAHGKADLCKMLELDDEAKTGAKAPAKTEVPLNMHGGPFDLGHAPPDQGVVDIKESLGLGRDVKAETLKAGDTGLTHAHPARGASTMGSMQRHAVIAALASQPAVVEQARATVGPAIAAIDPGDTMGVATYKPRESQILPPREVRKHVALTPHQQDAKRARNRRRHKRALTRRSGGRTSDQLSIRADA